MIFLPARCIRYSWLFIHALAGQDYNQVILVQMIVLACFPAVLYLLGKEFGSRPAGIMLALLTIFREIHSIQAAPFTRSVANVKLYFSEIPTALGLSLFLLFCVRWMKRREQPGLNPLLAGGMLGITMLIRTQSLAVLPFVLLFALVTVWPDWKKLLLPAALLIAGLVVTVAPWLWRNYQITNAVVFDHPLSQNWEMARRYAIVFEEDPAAILDRQPGENDGDFVKRLNSYTVNAILSHPDYAFENHRHQPDQWRTFQPADFAHPHGSPPELGRTVADAQCLLGNMAGNANNENDPAACIEFGAGRPGYRRCLAQPEMGRVDPADDEPDV